MKLLLILTMVLVSASGFATTLNCQLQINNGLKSEVEVQSALNTKVAIAKTADVTGYLVEKNDNQFSIEAFLPNSDARMYAEGNLKSVGDKLTAGFWARDLLVDLTCRRLP